MTKADNFVVIGALRVNDTLSVKESCGTEKQTEDKSVPGDPGGETGGKATNNQGTLFNISFH